MRHREDIDVVVLRTDDVDEPDDAQDEAPGVGRRRRRLAALVAASVVAVSVALPVVRHRPVEEQTASEVPVRGRSECPGPQTRRLWCSFVGDDDTCCPPDGQPHDPPSSLDAVD